MQLYHYSRSTSNTLTLCPIFRLLLYATFTQQQNMVASPVFVSLT